MSEPNHLINETSPYLQQHAHNPVDWYPWGEEAFELARLQNKAIFLSIGYATCHWCHVMERESFEDAETAALMNDLFVNIKVDREERPDIDTVYMTAAQLLSGSGGWPLSVWLTPQLKPWYIGTYFPPRSAWGRPGFRDVLRQLHAVWEQQHEKAITSAEAIMQGVAEQAMVQDSGSEPQTPEAAELAERLMESLERSFDNMNGGFSGAPKFPRPAILEFLLRHHARSGSHPALAMATETMRRMALGGMYDQLGGGFARYSVDAEWHVPHFEKMLYDQGQLLGVYADAFRITGEPLLERTIRRTIDYLERDMLSTEGAFYSAEDADSEGEEGTFYVWTIKELEEILSKDEFQAVQLHYGATQEGNFEHGKNVLHTTASVEEVALALQMSINDVETLLAAARTKLFDVRSRRVRPMRDEKILVSWNGLAISGLARSAIALNEPRYAHVAVRAARVILDSMQVEGRLMHVMKDGNVKIGGYLEDYAFLAWGLLDLYDATLDVVWLRQADRLVREADQLFADHERGGYFMTAESHDPNVPIRSKGDYDGAEPSGNSVMAMNALRIGSLFHDNDLIENAGRTISLFSRRIKTHPIVMPLMVSAAVAATEPPRQVVVAAGADLESTQAMLQAIRNEYQPDRPIVLIPPEGVDPWLAERMPTVESMSPLNGRTAAYVCEGLMCKAPVTEWPGRD